jgi:putative ABC transport system permease protein
VRISDLLGLAISALWQQKARTLLTTLGVMFGSLVLAASLSINQGVQDTIERFVRKNDWLRRVDVSLDWSASDSSDQSVTDPPVADGKIAEDKRQRIEKELRRRRHMIDARAPKVMITEEVLKSLGQIPNVEAAVPLLREFGFAILGDQAEGSDIAAARLDEPQSRHRLVAGRLLGAPDAHEALVSEFLLYRLGITDPAEIERVIGKPLRLEFRPQRREGGFGLSLVHPDNRPASRDETAALEKVRQQLPRMLENFDLSDADRAALKKGIGGEPAEQPPVVTEDFTIVGVLRLMSDEEQRDWDPLGIEADVLVPFQAAAQIDFRLPKKDQRLNGALLIVDREENAKSVAEKAQSLGLRATGAFEYIQQQRVMYHLIFGGMTCVAAVALLVAALGIANTMLISVLERTREIGLMKAVGARNGHLQLVFLVEGALIGLVGSVLGLLLAWGLSYPGDAWVRSTAARDLNTELNESIFVFPAWLIAAVAAFAILVTILAAVYPARRAAKIDPVAALRHE